MSCSHCQPFLHAEMAALKLITSSVLVNTSCFHCPPFSHAEMAALKLNTLASQCSVKGIYLTTSNAEMAALKLITSAQHANKYG